MEHKSFAVGDLVWAKMSGYCFWPAKIVEPPKTVSIKKRMFYVMFFGTLNCAFIKESLIVPHSHEEVAKANKKKKMHLKLKQAIVSIIEESARPLFLKNCSSKEQDRNGSLSEESDEDQILLQNDKSIEYLKEKREGKVRKIVKRKQNLSPVLIKKKSENINSTVPSISEAHQILSNPLDSKSSNETEVESDQSVSSNSIGFLGLGNMGREIVKKLLKTGHKVTVWNRTRDKCEDLTDLGAIDANTPAEVVKNCDLIFSCLSGPEASREVLSGKDGVLQGLESIQSEANKTKIKEGKIGKKRKVENALKMGKMKGYVEFTSLDPDTSISHSVLVAAQNCRYLEAPMIGSRKSFDDGSLVIIAGGDLQLFQDCESYLIAISNGINYVGSQVGVASKHTLIARMMVSTAYAGVAEAMILVHKVDIVPVDFLKTLELISVDNSKRMFEKAISIVNRNFEPVTTLKYQSKSMQMALELSKSVHQNADVTVNALKLYNRLQKLNLSEKDVSALIVGLEGENVDL